MSPALHSFLQVGFLKILHKYEISFLLPLVPRLGKAVCALPLPNPNLRVISVTPLPEGKIPPLSPWQLLVLLLRCSERGCQTHAWGGVRGVRGCQGVWLMPGSTNRALPWGGQQLGAPQSWLHP